MQRTCTRCGVTKGIENYYADARRIVAQCKRCCRDYEREHRKNPSVRAMINERDRKRRKLFPAKAKAYIKRRQEVVYQYLLTHPCVDCGETNPVILEFDHVRGAKSFAPTTGPLSHSVNTMLDEISKCDVRCTNCHKRRTARSYGTWRARKASNEAAV